MSITDIGTSSTTGGDVLIVENLTKIYGREIPLGFRTLGRRVIGVDNSSFSVKKGEIFGFLGPNGAGKTTTIRSILGYLKIQNGKITVLGRDYKQDQLSIRQDIGYVPGDMALYGNFTGEEIIEYYGKFRPINQEFLEEVKKQFIVDLTLKIGSLSTGNRKQVGLILALASKPDFLILDEPTTGLDPLMTATFHRIIKGLKSEGITIFLSSHDLSEVQAVCDRVGIIKEGKMILVEEVEELKSKFLQHVRISFNNNNIPEIEELNAISSVISATKMNDKIFTLQVQEDINDLLKFLTNYRVDRLSIEDASLEEIFLQYYQ
ncbi:MAG: ATP-binding cassette domain-containing protein [Candidatus Hodarchaeales archaeon]